jgi:hypothetical protein
MKQAISAAAYFPGCFSFCSSLYPVGWAGVLGAGPAPCIKAIKLQSTPTSGPRFALPPSRVIPILLRPLLSLPPICPPSSPPRPSRSLSDLSGWAFWTGFGLGLGAVRGVRPSIRRRPARPKHQAAIIPESCLVRCSPTSSPMSVHTLLIPPMRPLRSP